MLIEICSGAWTQYRNGVVYSVQHEDFESAILFMHGMVAMLPPPDRPTLPPIPVAKDLREDLLNKKQKWRWGVDSNFAIEDAISKWIYKNLDKAQI